MINVFEENIKALKAIKFTMSKPKKPLWLNGAFKRRVDELVVQGWTLHKIQRDFNGNNCFRLEPPKELERYLELINRSSEEIEKRAENSYTIDEAIDIIEERRRRR